MDAALRKLAARAGSRCRGLYLMRGKQAIYHGRYQAHAAIAVAEGLLMNLSVAQVRGVLVLALTSRIRTFLNAQGPSYESTQINSN
jgi:hypothetical protein